MEPLSNATVLINGNRIEAVLRAGQTIPPDALRIDARGKFVIPGLIDSHVHFFQSGGLYARPDSIDLRSVRPYTDELQWVKANLHDTFARYVRAGITSVVDVGGPFWNYHVRDEALRTSLAPRVLTAGPLISSVEREILNPVGDPPIVKIDTVDAAKALIDRELARRTDFVKFWWILPDDGNPAAFRPIVERAVDYAHSNGARVIVHATELETSRLALESGADILAHSVFDAQIDDQWLELARSRRAMYIPTLIVGDNYLYTFHGTPNLSAHDLKFANPDVVGTLYQLGSILPTVDPILAARLKHRPAPPLPTVAMSNLKRVHSAGIPIATGTDAGNIGTQHATSLYDELLVMVQSGITPRDALQMTTVRGAEMMGRKHDLGSIDADKLADIVILDEDPTRDIHAIASTHIVIKDGSAYRPEEFIKDTAAQTVQHFVNSLNAANPDAIAYFVQPGVSIPASLTNSRLNTTKRTVNGSSVTDDVTITNGADTGVARFRYRVHAGRIVDIEQQ